MTVLEKRTVFRFREDIAKRLFGLLQGINIRYAEAVGGIAGDKDDGEGILMDATGNDEREIAEDEVVVGNNKEGDMDANNGEESVDARGIDISDDGPNDEFVVVIVEGFIECEYFAKPQRAFPQVIDTFIITLVIINSFFLIDR